MKFNTMNSSLYCFISLISLVYADNAKGITLEKCADINSLDETVMNSFSKAIIPDLNMSKRKGEAGKILVIGGSVEYTGAPYFAAMTALKVGADIVHVITTETAAPIIKSYSPDLIVHPIRNIHSMSKISTLLPKMHIVVIGPGLGRESHDIELVYEVIKICKTLKKPLVIDADGLYAIAKNVSMLKDYPSPGAILTPNYVEAKRLKDAMPNGEINWYNYWGSYVSVLKKGQQDEYHSSLGNISWKISDIGSGRRAGGQGDILAGSLATFFHWAIESNICKNEYSVKIAQSIATYSASKFTRTCNLKAFIKLGRSMTASDMINEIHSSFTELFE